MIAKPRSEKLASYHRSPRRAREIREGLWTVGSLLFFIACAFVAVIVLGGCTIRTEPQPAGRVDVRINSTVPAPPVRPRPNVDINIDIDRRPRRAGEGEPSKVPAAQLKVNNAAGREQGGIALWLFKKVLLAWLFKDGQGA